MDKIVNFKNILDKSEINLIWNYMQLYHNFNKNNFCAQSKLGETFRYGDPLTDTLLLDKKQIIEKKINKELIPTYSFWRLYNFGSVLEKHTDRPHCEFTISINIAADKEWPLVIEDEKIFLEPGEGVLYQGGKYEHWRDEYTGDYSAQVFLHFVEKGGKNEHLKYDNRIYLGTEEKLG